MASDTPLLKQPFRYPPARCRCVAGQPLCPACQDEADAKRRPDAAAQRAQLVRRQKACQTTLHSARQAVWRAQKALKEVETALKALEAMHAEPLNP